MFRLKVFSTILLAALIVNACGGSTPTPASPAPASTTEATSGGATTPSATSPATSVSVDPTATADAGATTPAAGSVASPTAPPTDKAPLVTGGHDNVDTCKLVTKVEAKSALAEALGVTTLDTAVVHVQVLDSISDGSFSETCMYSFAQQKDGLDLTPDQGGKAGSLLVGFYPQGGAAWFARQSSGRDKALSGIGDKAFTTGPSVYVLKGDGAFHVDIVAGDHLLQPIPEREFSALAQKAVDRLPTQISGPVPSLPKIPAAKVTVAPTEKPALSPTVVAATPTVNPAVTTLTASLQAALAAAQAGDLAKAKSAFQPVANQWAAIPNDGKLITTDLYPTIGDAIKQTDTVLASPDTDAAAAASAIGDLSDGVTAALAMTSTASVMPQLSAAMATAVAAPTPILEAADKNAACALISLAEATALLGAAPEIQPLPSSNTDRSCNFVLLQQNGNVGKASAIQVDFHPVGGASWYVENVQRLTGGGGGYRSGTGIGDQFSAMGAQQIWVLKGDSAMAITMPLGDVPGTPIDEMKGLASKAAARMS